MRCFILVSTSVKLVRPIIQGVFLVREQAEHVIRLLEAQEAHRSYYIKESHIYGPNDLIPPEVFGDLNKPQAR